MANIPERPAEEPETSEAKEPVVERSLPILHTDAINALNAAYGNRGWHCDHIWADQSMPACVIAFLDVMRAPAVDQIGKPRPRLFATYHGRRVRIVMASRFGDVGITDKLTAEHGYSQRVFLPELTDFSDAA